MGARVLDGLVGLAVLASAGILVAMLAAPLLAPPPSGSPIATPSATASASDDPNAEPELPPLGLYQLRGRFPATGSCLGIELDAPAYPVAQGAEGVATVLSWNSSIVDPGNPSVCDTRIGDLETTEATVTRVADEDDPDGPPTGYLLEFHAPAEEAGAVDAALLILAARSTQDLLQVLDMTTSGSGFVFDRVASIDPPLVPVPSSSPTAATGPIGLFLLRGPLDADGPCLVLELEITSYPTDPGTEGTARVRWWERAIVDPDDPTACLSRIGDVREAGASVAAVREEGQPGGAPLSWAIGFSLEMPDTGATREVLLSVPFEQRTPDRLTATVVIPEGVSGLVFDRVDEIDPPLYPSPSDGGG